jgi:hypothetical protein
MFVQSLMGNFDRIADGTPRANLYLQLTGLSCQLRFVFSHAGAEPFGGNRKFDSFGLNWTSPISEPVGFREFAASA